MGGIVSSQEFCMAVQMLSKYSELAGEVHRWIQLAHAVYCTGSQSNSLRKFSPFIYRENVYSSSVGEDSKRHYYGFLQQGGSGLMY